MNEPPPIPSLYIILFSRLVARAENGTVTTRHAREVLARSVLGLDTVRAARVLEELEAYGLIRQRTREDFIVNNLEVPVL